MNTCETCGWNDPTRPAMCANPDCFISMTAPECIRAGRPRWVSNILTFELKIRNPSDSLRKT